MTNNGWIKCTDKLPKEDSLVDIITENPEYDLINKRFTDIRYSKKKWKLTKLGFEITGVTHWRYIPKAPKQ